MRLSSPFVSSWAMKSRRSRYFTGIGQSGYSGEICKITIALLDRVPMPAARSRSDEWLQRRLQGAIHPFGEFVHVSAIYLGIAVLTTLGLSLVLPSMREQSHQLHEVMLTMFQADGEGEDRKSDVVGRRLTVSVDEGRRRIIQKKTT